MPEIKITPAKLADLVFLAATGHPTSEIAQKLGVTVRTIQRYLAELKEESKRTSPQQAVTRVILEAGPSYLLRLTPLKLIPEEIIGELGSEK